MNEQEYFDKWDAAKLLTEEIKETVYNKYLVKCKVFQRDEFTCQNVECERIDESLTMHHVRFQKNSGKDNERNCITLCALCHKNYHRGKIGLTFADKECLHNRLRGKTFEINKMHEINWKQVNAEMKQLRRNLRHLWNPTISTEQFQALMVYLFMPFDDDWDS